MTHNITSITVAYGDGIGPEIMEATLLILQEAGAAVTIETIEIGERIYKQGAKDGILPSAWPQLARTGVLLKAPIIIPKSKLVEPLHVSIARNMQLTFCQQHPTHPQAIATKGENLAMFETIQDATPKKAGKDTANPSSMIHAALLMLEHIGQASTASRIARAWEKTIQSGIHTADIATKETKEKVGTQDFARAMIARL